ncbi:MAG: GNAT family N-acetyltransferase [Bacteroidia bacterium]
MQVKHQDDSQKGIFYIESEAKTVAKMTYVWAGTDRIIIDHTEVADSLRGKGLAKQMIVKAINFAREKGIRIVPLCPFVKSVIDKTPEYQDVL